MNKIKEGENRLRILRSTGSVQFLLAGHSTGHILKVIEEFHPEHIELFTSSQLQSSVSEFIMSLSTYNGTHHVQCIPSFKEDSIMSGVSIISVRYQFVKSIFPFKKVYFGITGGTNTMAVEMAMSALLFRECMHYVVKDLNNENDFGKVMIFDTEALYNFLDTAFSRGVK